MGTSSFENERFEVVRQVGEGGFGLVYEALVRQTGARVAVKVLRQTGQENLLRFEREGALLARLRHPSIVRYVAHGRTQDGCAYLAMEWLEGQPLDARLRQGRLTPEECRVLGLRVASGLAHAHAKAVIHRDVKPANIFLPGGALGEAKLLDFGIARPFEDSQGLSRSGVPLGTPLYMSPEQARGERTLGPESDIFSLGSVLYECLTGAAPFLTQHALATLAKICLEDPAPLTALVPTLSPAFAVQIQAMLRKTPVQRPSARALEDALTSSPFESSQPGVGVRDLGGIEHARLSASLRPEGEQRVLSALFLKGVDMQADARAQLDGDIRALGVRAVRLLGGAEVFLFERLATPAQQALGAARFARRVRALIPDAVMSLCTGRAARGRELWLGDLFERGARMLESIDAGTIAVDDDSAGLLDALFELTQAGQDHTLGQERVQGEAPRTLLGQVTPFVGRERQLAQLDAVWNECLEDELCQVLLFMAPAGAGKSRLRYEWMERMHAGEGPSSVLIGRGDAVNAQAPFGLLRPLLRAWVGFEESTPEGSQSARLVERLETLLAPERVARVAERLSELLQLSQTQRSPQLIAERSDAKLMADQLLAAFSEWFEALCTHGPVLCVLEDLHWADAVSIRFLEVALRTVPERPVMVAAFARPEVRESHPRLFSGTTLILGDLPKLARRACERMLDGLVVSNLTDSVKREVVERADGNPFFLEELVRSLRSGKSLSRVPDTVLGVLEQRLADLGEEGRLILRASSVFGERFLEAGVRSLLGEQRAGRALSDWLEELEAREVVFVEDRERGQYGFRHALIRDAAYAMISEDDRVLAHAIAGEWLAAQGTEAAAVVAEHFERGHALQRAGHFWCAAANAADVGGAFAEVIRCGERAFQCGAEGDEFLEVAGSVAIACTWTGAEGADTWAQRVRVQCSVGSRAWWRASQGLSVLWAWRGAQTDFAGLVHEMLAAAIAAPATPEQAEALSVAAHYACFVSLAIAAPLLVRGESCAKRVGGVSEALVASVRGTYSKVRGELSAALRHVREAGERFRELGALAYWADTQLGEAVLLCELGELDHAGETASQGLVLARRLGTVQVSGFLFCLCLVALHSRQWARLRKLVQELRASIPAELPGHLAAAQGLLALAHSAEGDHARAAIEAAQALAARGGGLDDRPVLLATAALVDGQSGRPEQALIFAEQAWEELRTGFVESRESFVRLIYIQCLFACGRADQARGALQETYRWLMERASKIEEPEQRASMLTRISENAEIIRLAASELGIKTALSRASSDAS